MVEVEKSDIVSQSSQATAVTKDDFKFAYPTKESIIEEQQKAVLAQDHLAQQTLEGFDPTKINALTPEIISRQATINIGTIGHVAHGKSTLVKAVSGTNTVRHYKEMFRNITIKLGYANAKLYKCGKCPAPQCYISYGSSKEDNVKCTQEGCEATMVLSRHVSFVDCPGHDTLMATMLAGAAVMDAALLLVDGNQAYPQPQTREHLIAVDIMKLEHIIVLQNKIDIAIKDRHSVQHQQEQIKASLSSSGNVASAPIIPISAQLKFNIDVVVDYLCRIPIPERQFTVAPYMIVIRSFDVNKPGEDAETLKGGVAGGTILKGCLKVGDEVCIRPGYVSKSKKTGLTSWVEIKSRITSLQADDNQLMYAVPGGLIAVGMKVDPQFTRSDAMVGHIIGLPGQMPQVFIEIDVQTTFLKRIVGSKDEQSKSNKIENIRENETLLINIGSTSCGGLVMSVRDNMARIQMTKHICANMEGKIALSRKFQLNFRLIGWGVIKKGYEKKNE